MIIGRNKKGQFIKGITPWIKGKTKKDYPQISPYNNLSEIEKQKLKERLFKRMIGNKLGVGNIPWNKGLSVHLSPHSEFRKGNIPWNKELKGVQAKENHPGWKGGISSEKGYCTRVTNNKRKRDPEYDAKFRCNRNIKEGIRRSLKGKKAGRRWESLTGYTINDLMSHLESLFEPWMNWDNYGKWHIDHICPISSFNYTKPEDSEFRECWALENLRPLEAIENIRKQAKYESIKTTNTHS